MPTKETTSIYTRLINVQNALKAPKNKDNSFGKYKYRSLEDILENAKPLLKDNGLILILDDEIVEISGRFYVKARATVIDEDGNEINAVAYARESESKSGMDAAQLTGSCSSYARKYAVSGLFCIDNNKDIDSDEYTQQGTQQAAKTTRKKKTEPVPDSVANAVLNPPTPDDVPVEITDNPDEMPPYFCVQCGNEIKDSGKYKAETIAASSLKSFGARYCMECGRIKAAEIKAAKERGGN